MYLFCSMRRKEVLPCRKEPPCSSWKAYLLVVVAGTRQQAWRVQQAAAALHVSRKKVMAYMVYRARGTTAIGGRWQKKGRVQRFAAGRTARRTRQASTGARSRRRKEA